MSITGVDCYDRLEPYLSAGLSMFAMSARNLTRDMALDTLRGAALSEQLRQRVIRGSQEHGFEYWLRPPRLATYLEEADEEMVDAIVYLSLWNMQRERKR